MSIAPRSPIPKLAELDVHLTTARCKLRPFRDDDVEDLWPTVSDPAFSKWMSWSAHVDRDETLAFIRAQRQGLASGTDLVWAIEHDGHAVGCIGLNGIRWVMRALRIDRAELGYWLTPALAKQGLMTEAALAVLGFAFDTVGLHKITVGCIAENVASRRVIEKCGFRHVGRAEDDVWRDGQWWAHLRYEMTAPEFTAFLNSFISHAAQYSQDGAIHYICMDWRHMGEVLDAAGELYELKNVCVWNKTNGGMGTFYRSKHEMVFVFKAGSGPHINNFGLGEKGRYRTNVWDYPGVNTFRRGRMDELRAHPTVKPLALVVDALKDCSKRGGIVLDPFVGSGTTLLAAEKTGRLGRAIELDPHYVDAAIGRWQALTGQTAVHSENGKTFNEMAAAAHAADIADGI